MTTQPNGDASMLPMRFVRIASVVHAMLLTAYVIAILVGTPKLAPGPGNIIQGSDSQIYLFAARHWPWNPFAARVAPLYPLLVALVGRQIRLLIIAQTILWGSAWQWLARSTARLARQRVAQMAIVVVLLALSLAPELLIWNAAVASEGLSISCVVATFAAALTAIRHTGSRWWLIASGFLAVSTIGRDTNAIVAIGVIVVAAGVFVRRRQWRGAAVLSIVMCASAVVGSNALANQADPPRWFYPLQENIVERVTPVPEYLAWFTAHGMPQSAAVASLRPSYFYSRLRLEQGPEFAPFRAWLREHGQSVYFRFVLTHAKWQARSFIRDRGYVLLPSVALYAHQTQATPGRVFGWFGWLSFWRSAGLMWGWAALGIIAGAVGRLGWRRDDRTLRWMLVFAVATAALHAFVAYVGDYFEVGRHTLTANMQLRVALWIITLLIVDRNFGRIKTVSSSAGSIPQV